MVNCPECGAAITADQDCQAAFDECLVLEFTNPAYGAVHHLTVAAYMLQHPSKLSLDGWLSMRQLLIEFLVEGKSPQEIRVQNRHLVDSGKRTWKFRPQVGEPRIQLMSWTKTILDVRSDSAETYCRDIVDWAGTVLRDSLDMRW